ncbi:expressed unknown protein [Seminavis robusta]|uniref:Uncharacterized protein n=1 Tax=Seminavis robusta TaxID=568900 RepID=A0A9N8E089_9STRA|nr:expressed unknown protein [Seminavis robusta]|eukprot:Sro434_g142120.1 n/a (1124) ;mRNA; r:46927-50556
MKPSEGSTSTANNACSSTVSSSNSNSSTIAVKTDDSSKPKGDTAKPTVPPSNSNSNNNKPKEVIRVKEEHRDDTNKDGGVAAPIAGEHSHSHGVPTREPSRDPAPSSKRSSKSKKSSSSSGSSSRNTARYPHERYPYPSRGPYSAPGMHGGPRGPPPPPHYGYPGGPPPDHYRGPPPPPHFHQMPPLHHQGGHYGGPPGPNGHYGPPPPPSMGGRHPGAGYGVPYGHYMSGPPMPYHAVPPYPGSNPSIPMNENNSISSNKSKSSAPDRKSKSQSSKSGGRKKRTIDGVHEIGPHHHHHHHHHHPQDLPSAYSFRRTNSSASSSTTVTAGNNTSSETNATSNDDNMKRDRMHELPPLSHPSHNASFEEGSRRFAPHHRRDHSGASTTSSLSVGGFSLSSHDRGAGSMDHPMGSHDDAPMMKQSPKRRKGEDSKVLVVDTGNCSSNNNSSSSIARHQRPQSSSSHSIDGTETTRFEQLTMEDRESRQSIDGASQASGGENGSSLFLSLSTSPINHATDIDATPISKNTKKTPAAKSSSSKHDPEPNEEPSSSYMKQHASVARKPSADGNSKMMDRPTDTPTPPLPGGMVESEMMTDEHSMLNRHLRGQSFTPLNHMGALGDSTSAAESPSNMGAFGSIAPQLSWSIAGDTPSLGDLAEWEEHATSSSGGQLKDEKKRPNSTTSCNSRNMAISPHSFSMWNEDENIKSQRSGDADSIRLSILTPHSELGMAEGTLSGTTTPLPIFFDQPSSEERENRTEQSSRSSRKKSSKSGDPEHIHHIFVSNGGRGSAEKGPKGHMHHFWSKDHGAPTPVGSGMDSGPPMGLPPTPLFAASEFGRDDGFVRSPLHGGDRHRDDFFPSSAMYGHPGHDRVRSLRGRVPPGHHLAPMPLHIPPPMSSHLPLTSPMGVGPGKAGLWSPHHGGMPPLGSPLHMSPMNMSQSKRKCVPLKPPIPSKFQGDIEKVKTAQVPEFTSLVNFPAHMSQKQAVNLPDGMRCCVMCGQACPCSSGNKNKKGGGPKGSKNNDGSLAPRNSNGQDMMGDKGGYAIIPTQNKGLCTLCDVNVWVVVTTGLEIKWCKGCKNFRPWAAFGDKGLATKCLRCRERQREKYALQKEEKEKARLVAKAGKK